MLFGQFCASLSMSMCAYVSWCVHMFPGVSSPMLKFVTVSVSIVLRVCLSMFLYGYMYLPVSLYIFTLSSFARSRGHIRAESQSFGFVSQQLTAITIIISQTTTTTTKPVTHKSMDGRIQRWKYQRMY